MFGGIVLTSNLRSYVFGNHECLLETYELSQFETVSLQQNPVVPFLGASIAHNTNGCAQGTTFEFDQTENGPA
jgi:hypothetical protein